MGTTIRFELAKDNTIVWVNDRDGNTERRDTTLTLKDFIGMPTRHLSLSFNEADRLQGIELHLS